MIKHLTYDRRNLRNSLALQGVTGTAAPSPNFALLTVVLWIGVAGVLYRRGVRIQV
jgi:hypothetical protein